MVGKETRPMASYPSFNIASGSNEFNAAIDFFCDLTPLSLIINKIIEELDLEETEKLNMVCKGLQKKASFSALHSISPSIHEAITVIYNRRSGSHIDKNNTPNTWTPMAIVGWFKGGDMVSKKAGI